MGTSPASFSTTDLYLYQGDTFSATVTVLNSDGSTPDLTGYSAEAQIRIAPADYAPLAASFACQVDPLNTVYLTLDSATSGTLIYEQYVWDLQLTTPDGLTVQTVLSGRVNVTLEVTRDTSAARAAPVEAVDYCEIDLDDLPPEPKPHKPLDPAVVGWRAAIIDALERAVRLEARLR